MPLSAVFSIASDARPKSRQARYHKRRRLKKVVFCSFKKSVARPTTKPSNLPADIVEKVSNKTSCHSQPVLINSCVPAPTTVTTLATATAINMILNSMSAKVPFLFTPNRLTNPLARPLAAVIHWALKRPATVWRDENLPITGTSQRPFAIAGSSEIPRSCSASHKSSARKPMASSESCSLPMFSFQVLAMERPLRRSVSSLENRRLMVWAWQELHVRFVGESEIPILGGICNQQAAGTHIGIDLAHDFSRLGLPFEARFTA